MARDLAKTYPSKDTLCHALEETARIPLGVRAFANYWGNPGSALNPAKYPLRAHERRIAGNEGASETATPPWLAWIGAERMETVPAMASGKSALIVTGDPSRNKSLCVPGGGFATVKIVLPNAWDALMAERGYKPLADFRLTTALKPDTPAARPRKVPTHTGDRGDRPYGTRRQRNGERSRSPQWECERPRSPQWEGERPREPQRWGSRHR